MELFTTTGNILHIKFIRLEVDFNQNTVILNIRGVYSNYLKISKSDITYGVASVFKLSDHHFKDWTEIDDIYWNYLEVSSQYNPLEIELLKIMVKLFTENSLDKSWLLTKQEELNERFKV